MAGPGVEALVGLTTELGLGQFLVAGLGGVFAESLDDIVSVYVPSTRGRVAQALAAFTLGRILTSTRRVSSVGVQEVVDILMRLQVLAQAAGDRLAAVDINPLWLGENASSHSMRS